MKLQTNIPLQQQEPKINYDSKLLLMGSCFIDNIGGKLSYYKFNRLQNPFGVLFHPVAIEKLISKALQKEYFTSEDLYEQQGYWFCFEVHSSLYASTKGELLELLNSKLDYFREYITTASHIIITFGTAWVYRHIARDSIVANCNKLPQHNFKKELLDVEILKKSMATTFSQIKTVNELATIIVTVSPIRHIKDGFVENTISKAHLISALHNNSYKPICFPSYEIMMDQLRDYRFYKEDMIHPNETAITIIWDAFKDVWISKETTSLFKKIESIQSRLQHKPFRPESSEHQQFLDTLKTDIDNLKKEFPQLNFLENS